MDSGLLMQFNLAKFVLDLDFFSVGLLALLVFSVTWLFSLLMTLRFDVNSALNDTSALLVRVKSMHDMAEVDRLVSEVKSGVGKVFFDSLVSELAGSFSDFSLEGVSLADAATKKFFLRSVLSSRDVVVDALCARVDRAVVAGWGVGLLSLCAILIRSLMLVLSHGAMLAEGVGVDRWLFGTLLYAIIGVWGVCVTSWVCGFLKITVCSMDQQLKRLCWRVVFLSDRS